MRPEPTRVPPSVAARGTRRRPVARAAAAWLALACIFPAARGPHGTSIGADIDTAVTATWTGVGLRRWAGSLGAKMRAPIIVDRRLDPDAPVSLDCRDEPLVAVVERVAGQVGGEPAVLASSIRIAPVGKGGLLVRAEAARAARLAALPAAQRAIVSARTASRWPAGATPAELVAALATEAGVPLTGTASLPHDHLPAMSLPPLSLAERLDLVLADYDLRVDWRSGDAGRPAGRIIPLDADLPRPDAAAAARRPAPVVRPQGRKPPGIPPRPGRAEGPRETFSLQVAAPLDEVLAAIAKRLDLSLEIDAESLRRRGVAPGEIVKATVKDASRDQLLDAILVPLELRWTIDAGTLRVAAAPPEPASTAPNP